VPEKDGAAVAWTQLNPDAANVDASLELPPDEAITGRLVDIEGQSAAGIELVLRSVMKRSSDGIPYRGSTLKTALNRFSRRCGRGRILVGSRCTAC